MSPRRTAFAALALTALLACWGGLREDPRFGELCTKIGLSAPSLS